MRWFTLLLVAMLGGCNWMCGKLAETAMEKAAGVEVDRNGDQITIKTKEGSVTTTQTAGPGGGATTVITNEKGEKVVMASDENKVRIEGDKGVLEYGADGKVPDGFPLSVVGGATVMGNAHNKADGRESYMVSLQTDKTPIAIADHYATELTGKDFKIERSQMSANGQTVATVSASKDGTSAQITAMTMEGQPKTQVTLMWETH
ncbi:MAG: hypothetical protein ABIJ09_17825 [Pseudomonadota bacterium]